MSNNRISLAAAPAWKLYLLAMTQSHLYAALSVVVLACPLRVSAQVSAMSADTEWSAYGRTPLGDRHSPLTQIDTGNVSRLQVAWRFHTGEGSPDLKTKAPTALEVTPLVFRGTMYLSTPLGRVFAIDPTTGAERWRFDPKVDRTTGFGDFANRGVALWVDHTAPPASACALRVFVATIDTRLIALDATTGLPCAGFGERGEIQLRHGLRNAPAFASEYEETSPPTVVNGIVVIGSAVADNNRIDAASGEVRGFDARTGALRWTWDPVPHDPDPASATWVGSNAHRTGAANAWSVFASDAGRDLVFVPTGSPSVDYFGGERKGRNQYANSIVAIRASTGRTVWSFQTVRHDLWDYDNASPPALVDVQIGGRRVPAVLQATKTGQLFVLDRETGKPLFPVTEGRVPASDVAGEDSWPTQILNSGLPPLSPQTLAKSELWGSTAEDRSACSARLDALRNDGTFTPPSMKGSLIIPSNVGGAHWGGVAYDPASSVVVVPVNRIAAVITLIPRAQYEGRHNMDMGHERIGTEYAMMHGTPYVLKRELFLAPSGAPCTPPPFGSLVAMSLRTRSILWSVPLGTSEGLDKIGIHAPPNIPGAINLGGPITTAGGLVFIGAALDRYFRAFDLGNGRELWKVALPAGGKATPMTYMGADGRQYVVIAAGGDGKAWGWSDEIVAFALPRSGR